MPSMRARHLALLCVLAGCSTSPGAAAYERCVNAEAEAKFERAAEACREAAKLDPNGEVGKQARAKLDSMAPHLKGKSAPSAPSTKP